MGSRRRFYTGLQFSHEYCQHELRQKYREQINALEEQLHEATHFNPTVAALQAKVEELEQSNREHEQKLRFAVRHLEVLAWETSHSLTHRI